MLHIKPKVKKIMLLSSILIFGCPAYAAVNTNYQFGQTVTIEQESVVLPITNHAIILNPEIDAISANDPRIKTVIDYAKSNEGLGVTVVFANAENLRYVKKINQMFTANGVFATEPQLTKGKNIMEFNLVKIYVIKNHSVINGSGNVQKSAKPKNLDD